MLTPEQKERKLGSYMDAIEAAHGSLTSQAALLRECAEKLEQETEQSITTANDLAELVNEVENVLRNLNLARIVRHAVELSAYEGLGLLD